MVQPGDWTSTEARLLNPVAATHTQEYAQEYLAELESRTCPDCDEFLTCQHKPRLFAWALTVNSEVIAIVDVENELLGFSMDANDVLVIVENAAELYEVKRHEYN